MKKAVTNKSQETVDTKIDLSEVSNNKMIQRKVS